MLPLLKAHWRACAVVLALVLSFAFGRFATPPRIQTVTKTVDHTEELTKAREQVNELQNQVETLKRHTHEVKTVVVRKDGTKTVQDVTDTSVDRQTQTQTQEQAVTVAQTQTETTHTEVASVTVTPSKPQWRVSLLAGIEPLHLDRPALLGPVSLGAMVEHRLVGPLWVGVWGDSSGVGGLALSVEF